MNTDIIIVDSIDEITEVGVKYAPSKYPEKYIKITRTMDGELSVFGFVSGQHPTSICGSTGLIKSWKTFNGLKRSLKSFTKSGAWGFGKWRK